MNRILGVVAAALLAVTVAACSDSSGPDTPPELERIDGERALITMCQGGALGIAVVLERIG